MRIFKRDDLWLSDVLSWGRNRFLKLPKVKSSIAVVVDNLGKDTGYGGEASPLVVVDVALVAHYG